MNEYGALFLMAAIIFGAFLSEDGATITAITALTAAAWVLLTFLVIRLAPSHAGSLAHELEVLSLVGLSLYASLTLVRRFGPAAYARFSVLSERMRRWEFWPAWLFYLPVAGFCAWLGIRFRGLALPTVANPSQKNGGVVGESKSEILRTLMETSPELTADAFLIPAG